MPEVASPAISLDHLAVVACQVLENELRLFSSALPRAPRETIIVRQDLHDTPDRLREELQATLTRLEANPKIHGIALAYGLCSRGIEGLNTVRVPWVVPRAHDCITLFLGSKERYAALAAEHPGTYWYTPGWIACTPMPSAAKLERLRAEYLETYGEEDGAYLLEMEQEWIRAYNRATFTHLGHGAIERDRAFTEQCARELKWQFDEQAGDPSLLRDLLAGRWDPERFLLVPPGRTVRLTSDARVIDLAKES